MAEVGVVAREERKVVTVLSADLVGFTARSERLDPEDVRGRCSRTVGQHGLVDG
jgi:class 3 adenylate cyclase